MNAILEEILSDYLDERLSPEECTELEQRLAREPELQAAYDSLRTVRDALQRLPPVSPASDWSESVLGRAKELASATEAGESVQLPQRASSEQSGPRRLRPASYLRFWPVGVIAGLLLIGFFWQRNGFVEKRLAEKAPTSASSAASPPRSRAAPESSVVAPHFDVDSVEAANQEEEAILPDAPAVPLARTPAAAAQADTEILEAGASAGLRDATRSVLLQREHMQAETVSVRVELPKNLFHVVLANHHISPRVAKPQLDNQLRSGRASASRVPREPVAERGRQELYVVEGTLNQLNAVLQELATQGSVEVLDESAIRKRQESAVKLMQSKTTRLETSSDGHRARRATEPEKSLARSTNKPSAKVRRPVGKTAPRYRILFLLDPHSTGQRENR